ncbi:hypothetical protein ES703_45041 [subsurface metagenome]
MIGNDAAGAIQGQLQSASQAGTVNGRYRWEGQPGDLAEDALALAAGLGGLLRGFEAQEILDVHPHNEVVGLTADENHPHRPGIVLGGQLVQYLTQPLECLEGEDIEGFVGVVDGHHRDGVIAYIIMYHLFNSVKLLDAGYSILDSGC